MVRIDNELCIGCGLCVGDCFPKNIIIEDKKAKAIFNCMECGHCVAVCPQNAVSIEGYEMGEVEESTLESAALDPDLLLKAIKGRRSIRRFIQKPIEDKKQMNIIEAGRYTSTGSNLQGTSYVIVRDNLPQLTKMALESLNKEAQEILLNTEISRIYKVYARRWITMCDHYSQDSRDDLFFHAPAAVCVVSDSAINAGLAASNMELMTFAQGLGMFYSGFFVRAANQNKEIKQFLNIEDEKEVQACLVLGYPDVKYYPTAPRKQAKVVLK
ncbi:nitroreductase family protein [Alkalibaculum bacchi]|uniref:nitroreductase family protein n=1 Tax=Alkalibaculum bacchi TaxID=645887 RepID=UPI0026F36F90|nr:nitroreductase family protein [Alkalibaculum bacchi]